MWMNQKTVFLPGTWALASLEERLMSTGRRKGEEAQIAGSAGDVDVGGTHQCVPSTRGRGRQGVGHRDGDTNGERGKNRVQENGSDEACAS